MSVFVIQANPKRKILVVDDEPAIRKLIRITLERAGYVVLEASNGREALSRFSNEIAGLVTDIDMPETNGLELVCQVRQSRPDLPVLFISALCTQYAGELSGFACLVKPFDIHNLTREVHQLVERDVPELEVANP
jgi:CheY-like chemotaxis protein